MARKHLHHTKGADSVPVVAVGILAEVGMLERRPAERTDRVALVVEAEPLQAHDDPQRDAGAARPATGAETVAVDLVVAVDIHPRAPPGVGDPFAHSETG